MTRYALALLERNAAIDGTRKAQLALSSQVALTAYAKSLIGKRERSVERIAVRNDNKRDSEFNLLIKHATEEQADQIRLSKIDKRTFKKYEVWLRNAFTGKTRVIECKAMDYLHAVKQVVNACGYHERVIEREIVRK